jgi:hypothetical protein
MSQLNISVIFSGKPIGSEEFLNRMVKALGIIIDRRQKGKSRKNGKLNHRKNRMSLFKLWKNYYVWKRENILYLC